MTTASDNPGVRAEPQVDAFSMDFSQWSEDASAPAWDVLIVGSGYGASVAATTLAGCTQDGRPLRTCMLERGREYCPGDFAASVDELPAQARVSLQGRALAGSRQALWDLRLGADASVLLANGLGGGSLINAAVMAKPLFEHHSARFPARIKRQLQRAYLDAAQRLLGGAVRTQQGWRDNTVERHLAVQGKDLPKTTALKGLAAAHDSCYAAAVTTAMRTGEGAAQASALQACSLCGDCLTGCNVGAKASLDLQLLARARQRGLQIFTGASVLRLHRHDGLWQVEVVHTDPAQQRAQPVHVRAKRVILAAGALGSTEILMRSSRCADAQGLHLSSRLGRQFSGNGDNLCGIEIPEPVHSVGDEFMPVSDELTGISPRRVGPEITQTLQVNASASGPEFLVQEFSVPASLRRGFEELITTRRSLDDLLRWDLGAHRPWQAEDTNADPMAVDPQRIENTLLVGLIGHDASDGSLVLDPELAVSEGSLQIDWPAIGHDPAMADAYAKLAERVQARWGARARLIPNPLWRPVPSALDLAVARVPGAVLTVHPLGGCPVGESALTGVVDEWGAVFQMDAGSAATSDAWQGSLLVLDGAMVPGSLGANPALTIAALSLRAARHWRRHWGWTSFERSKPGAEPALPVRRRRREWAQCTPQRAAPTQFQIVERLSGVLPPMMTDEGKQELVAELTLGFQPTDLQGLTRQALKRLPLDPTLRREILSANTLRLYPRAQWERLRIDLMDDAARDAQAVLVAELVGYMDLAQRGNSAWGARLLRAGLALLRNRGGRDGLEAMRQQLGRRALDGSPNWRRGLAQLQAGLQLCLQAGELRLFNYQLRVDRVRSATPWWQEQVSRGDFQVIGHKRLTYACGENPWNQLLYLRLTRLGPQSWRDQPPALKLDARFLALKALPLIRVTRSAGALRDQMDWASLGLYWLRLLLKLHAWSLRQPDPASAQVPQRLPQPLPGLPVPQVMELDLEPGGRADGLAVRIRLTRFAAVGGKHNPLLLIHGYSVSGSTFAHPALQPSMAAYFWHQGRDVWIVDLRTSTALPTATLPWRFEDVAWADIPVAVAHIVDCVSRERGGLPAQVDIFAHCIGAVMLSMALLTDVRQMPAGARMPARYPLALQALKSRVGRVMLSQKGFAVRYVGANLLRAYVMGFVQPWLKGRYHFRPSDVPDLKERIFDAVLASLPYPDMEWAAEHPWFKRVPWSATRRRMDVLYERTFNINNMSQSVLEHLDDFFGPLNLQTVSEVRHFARTGFITDSQDHNAFVCLERLRQHWPPGETLLLSARDSGMVDPDTTVVMADMLRQAGLPTQRQLVAGGHQDSLIGIHAEQTFALVQAFLERPAQRGCEGVQHPAPQ